MFLILYCTLFLSNIQNRYDWDFFEIPAAIKVQEQAQTQVQME